MTHLQMLASSARPIAEVLVDALRRQTNALSLPDNPGIDDGNDGQGTLPLEDQAANIHDDVPTHALRPDKVAAAVLLGRAFDGQRNILAVLQNSDNVTVIEAPAPEYVGEIERILKGHILGPDVLVHEGSDLQPSATSIADPGTVVIFARGPNSKSKSTSGNAEFARAVQARCSVIGIAADPERLLPADLSRSADYRIVVPQLDGQAIATVIEAVTGCRPGAVEEDFRGRITLADLMVSVRADLGADGSLARLRRLLRSAMKNDASTPPLSEMHGLGEAKVWGMALASDLRDYKAGHLAWSVVDKGCLLSGPPGTGKTSFARSLAKETGMHFIATSYSQWQAHKEGHLGNVTQAIRNAFAESANMRPSILFIDEIDTLPARGSARWNDDWWTSITNTLLECLDGFERREGVVVIAACNDPSRLDPALVRSGRLDKHIRIPMPDTPALADILRSHLGEDLKNDDLLPAAVAAFGRTGADIERWVRTARRTARIAQRSLSLDDVVAAIRDGEPELPSEVRRGIAYHEAGHAVACIALGVADPIALSISRSGGLAQTSPGRMEAQTKSHLESYLVCLLAGRASDELVFGAATAGAGGSEESDLSRATRLATQFETTFGLGDLGPLWIGDTVGERDLLMFSDLRKTVRHTLERAHAVAKALLSENRITLDCLAEALFARGYLNRSEIEAILVQAPLRTKMAPDRLAAQPPQTDEPEDGPGREAVALHDA